MRNRREMVVGAVLLALMGNINLYNVTRGPRFDQFRSVDVVQLIATGMCFGVVLVMLVMFFRGRR